MNQHERLREWLCGLENPNFFAGLLAEYDAAQEELKGWRDTADIHRKQFDAAQERIRELESALRMLHDVCQCQNGCAPDDMTCATNVARAALAKAEKP